MQPSTNKDALVVVRENMQEIKEESVRFPSADQQEGSVWRTFRADERIIVPDRVPHLSAARAQASNLLGQTLRPQLISIRTPA